MEQLIFLVAVAVLSMLHAWWKKRNGQDDDSSETPQPGRPQQRPAAENWEEELRRLLQGDDATARPAPPPVIVQRPHPPGPPPLPAATHRRPPPTPPVRAEEEGDWDAGLAVKLPTLKQNAQAFLRGSQFEQRIAQHIHGADARVTDRQPAALARRASPVASLAVTLLRERPTQKAALLSGIIMGPPKALED